MNGYLLDTNVVSELRKGLRADAHVTAWFARRDRREIFLNAITLAELRRSIALISRRDPAHRPWLGRPTSLDGTRADPGFPLRQTGRTGGRRNLLAKATVNS